MKSLILIFFVCSFNWAFAQQSTNDSLSKNELTSANDYGMRIYDARIGRYLNPTLSVTDSMAKVYGWKRPEMPLQENKKKHVKAK